MAYSQSSIIALKDQLTTHGFDGALGLIKFNNCLKGNLSLIR